MHDAFQVTTVVDKVARIESIFAHGKLACLSKDDFALSIKSPS